MKQLGILTGDDLHSLELAQNKINCARQSLRPDAVPAYAPVGAKTEFFKEAIFAYADALYLQDSFWQDLAKQYCVSDKDMGKLWVDFNAGMLFLLD